MPSKVNRSASDCVTAIKQTAQEGTISDADAQDLLARIDRLAKQRQKKNNISREQALNEIAGEFKAEELTSARVQERNALLALQKRNEVVNFARQYVADTGATYGEALQAMLEGSAKLSDGSRFHVDRRMQETFKKYFGELVVELDENELFKAFRNGEHEEDVYRELYELTRPADQRNVGVSKNKKAQQIAEAVHRVREKMRTRVNEAGAYILPLEGYVTRQMHSVRRIRQLGEGDTPAARKKDSFNKWSSFVLPLLDVDRTFRDGQDPEKMLRSVHNDFYNGNHLKLKQEEELDLYHVKGGGNLAKKVSSHRKLHFRDADSALAYNKQFGDKGYSTSIMDEFQSMSRNIAMMEAFGPNAQDNFDKIVKELTVLAQDADGEEGFPAKARDSVKQIESLTDRRRLKAAWETVNGNNDIPANVTGAKIGQTIRSLQRMAKLGGVVISAIGDKAFIQTAMARQGMNQLDIMAKQITGMKLRTKEEKRMLRLMGTTVDSLMGNVAYRYDMHTKTKGMLDKMEEFFFHANGMNWWNNTQKSIASELQAGHLGVYADAKFEALPQELSNTLRSYGVTTKEWDVVRSTVYDMEGNSYVTPDRVGELPDSAFKGLLKDQGKQATTANVNRVRNDLELKIRSYIGDQADIAVPTPGAAERKYATLNTQAGTVKGEAARLMMMFKSFPITVWTKVMPNVFYSQGANTFGEFMAHDKKGKLLLIQMAALTTIGGYLSATIKDRLKGKTRKPLISKDGSINWKVWTDAFIRGGGAGIYGDLLFSEYNRHYQTVLGTMAGPVFGQLDQAGVIWSRTLRGEDASYQAMKMVKGNLPFANLPVVQTALDYHLWYQFQEMLNPGSLRRMERTLKREDQQEFLVSPSRFVK